MEYQIEDARHEQKNLTEEIQYHSKKVMELTREKSNFEIENREIGQRIEDQEKKFSRILWQNEDKIMQEEKYLSNLRDELARSMSGIQGNHYENRRVSSGSGDRYGASQQPLSSNYAAIRSP